ncbi:MAG TPA: CRTAC1 family protein [Nocardioides sp.]|uniref:CRTAC1 family protein n=1 Tax=Nocardioides sp. TaxID=35761 RepID=UPI002EDB4CFC
MSARERRALTLAMIALLVVLLGVRWSSEGTSSPDVSVQPPASPSVRPDPVVPTETVTVEPPLPRAVPTLSAAALDGISFVDATTAAGIPDHAPRIGGDDDYPGMTAGLALTRWPRIGSQRQALVSTSQYDRLQFWVVARGKLIDRTVAVGLGGAGRATAAGFADLDGDGDPDLVLGHQQDAVLSVWRNDRGFFRDVTRKTGVNPRSTARTDAGSVPLMRGLAFGDIDRNGHLDFVATDWNPAQLYIASSETGSNAAIDPDARACWRQEQARRQPRLRLSQTRLYLGTGSGRFRDATVDWRLEGDPVAAFTPQFVDLDTDGWLDLLIAGDMCSSRVLRNDGGRRFVDVTRRTKATQTPFGMGSSIADLDGDEAPDWIVTGISYPTASGACPDLYVMDGCSGNRVFTGKGDATFVDVTERSGLRHSGWGWGIAAEDFANSGRRQVAITNGYGGAGAYYEHFNDDPMSFFVRHRGRYVDVAPSVGLADTGLGHALLAFDYDDDGRLDILVNNADTGLRLYRNTTPRAGRHWVRVALDDPSSPTNRLAWGARVRVTSTGGSVTNCWVTSSTSYETSWPGECHVGLGGDAGPVRVEVWWPGEQTAQTYAGVPVDRRVTLRRR